jgi:hypothetical protein
VAAWIEDFPGSKPTIKQKRAAVRMLYDFLVVRQITPSNPAHSVRRPKYIVKKSKTPVWSREDGQLYGLSPDGSGVWHSKGTPDNWEQVGGPAGMIYAGANLLFATDPQTGDIYRYMWTPLQWERVGGPGKTFAVTGDGQLYGLSLDGSGVWHYKGTSGNWEQAGGPARMIYCGANLLFATDPQTSEIWLCT